MFKLLKRLFTAETDPEAIKLEEAIDLVVDESIPKLRNVGGYRKKLRQPVASALAHCAGFAGQIPGVLDLSGKDKSNLALVRGFFKDSDHSRAVVSESADLKDFLEKRNAEEIYFLLIMKRQGKMVFDAKLQGDIIVRDIAQQAQLFEEHKLIFPSETVEEVFNAIRLGLLKILAHHALELSLAKQGHALELKELKVELDVKLKIMRAGQEEISLGQNDAESNRTLADAQKLLDDIEAELDKVKTDTAHREFYLNQLTDVLTNPGQFLSVETIPMTINRLGVLIKSASCSTEDGICVAEFRLGNESRSFVLIKCRRDLLN